MVVSLAARWVGRKISGKIKGTAEWAPEREPSNPGAPVGFMLHR